VRELRQDFFGEETAAVGIRFDNRDVRDRFFLCDMECGIAELDAEEQDVSFGSIDDRMGKVDVIGRNEAADDVVSLTNAGELHGISKYCRMGEEASIIIQRRRPVVCKRVLVIKADADGIGTGGCLSEMYHLEIGILLEIPLSIDMAGMHHFLYGFIQRDGIDTAEIVNHIFHVHSHVTKLFMQGCQQDGSQQHLIIRHVLCNFGPAVFDFFKKHVEGKFLWNVKVSSKCIFKKIPEGDVDAGFAQERLHPLADAAGVHDVHVSYSFPTIAFASLTALTPSLA